MHAEKILSLTGRSPVEIEYGTVQGGAKNSFVIHGEAGIFTAKRAFSCVVNPEAGDKVMYSRDEHHVCHILAIIERPTHQHATLSFPGNVSIDSPHGQVSILGQTGVQLTSADSLDMVTDQVNVIARKGLLNINDATLTGGQVTSHIASVTTIAKSIDTVAERLTQKLKHSFRIIDGVDQTKAGDVLTTIKNLFSLRSRQSAMLAKKDIKIDAQRIHMG